MSEYALGDKVTLAGQNRVMTVIRLAPKGSLTDGHADAVTVAWHVQDGGMHTALLAPDSLERVLG